MGRHRHKKVSDKDAEENITKQLVESGKREELKNMVQRKFLAGSSVRCHVPLDFHFQLVCFTLPTNSQQALGSVLVIESFDFWTLSLD